MSLVDTKGHIFLPSPLFSVNNDNTTSALDAVGERLGMIMQFMKAGDIRKIHFRTGTVTTGDTIKASIQGVTALGFPDGTVAGSGTVAVADGDDSVWKTVDFGAGSTVAVTRGQVISVVLEFNSFVAGNLNIARQKHQVVSAGMTYNYYAVSDIAAPLTSGTLTIGQRYTIRTYVSDDDFTNVGASSNAAGVVFTATGDTPTHWAHSSQLGLWIKLASYIPCIALEYSDGTFYNNLDSSNIFGTVLSLSTATNPDQVGNYINIPFPCRATGFWVVADYDYDTTLTLYDSSDTVLANATLEADYRFGTGVGLVFVPFDSDPASTVNLTKDTWYRVVVEGPGTAILVYYGTVPSAAALNCLDLGTNCIYTSQNDGGGWSQTDTRRLSVGLIIDQLDDGAGAGSNSGVRNPFGGCI